MRDSKSQSRSWRRVAFALLIGLFAAAPAPRAAAEEAAPAPGPELFGVDSPLGRVEYHVGRGLRVGETGLTLGGFTTIQGERLEGGDSRGEFEGFNFFVFLDPVPFMHLFTELELSDLARWEDGREGVRSDPGMKVERLYGDVSLNDALSVRVGKFLTPIGRWSPVPAEPFVWTTSEPVIVEEVFDESMTGAMVFGSVFPRGGALSYSAYATFLDPIAPDRDAPPAEHSAGAYVEWASLAGWSAGASYFASEEVDGNGWNHLGGVDALWRPVERVELSGEAVFGEGTRQTGGALWGMYAQVAVETVETVWAVGRYERFDPPGSGRSLDLFDVGLAWVPAPYFRIKIDTLFADHFDELGEELGSPGFRGSLALLF